MGRSPEGARLASHELDYADGGETPPLPAFSTLGLLPDLPQRREPFEQVEARLGDEAAEKCDAGEHQEPAHRLFDDFHMALESREEGGDGLDGERGDDERNAETGGIDRE